MLSYTIVKLPIIRQNYGLYAYIYEYILFHKLPLARKIGIFDRTAIY